MKVAIKTIEGIVLISLKESAISRDHFLTLKACVDSLTITDVNKRIKGEGVFTCTWAVKTLLMEHFCQLTGGLEFGSEVKIEEIQMI